MALKPSGPDWCALYPTSKLVADLVDPFRANVMAFIAACRAAGCIVTVAATYRPPERAYLMHTACLIAGYRDSKTGQRVSIEPVDAQDAQALKLGIDWTHGGNRVSAVLAAHAMCVAYDIAYPAALESRHTQRRAVDMLVLRPRDLQARDKTDKLYDLVRGNLPTPELVAIGESYNVIKLIPDPPHWSDDGH